MGSEISFSQDSQSQIQTSKRNSYLTNLVDKLFDKGVVSTRDISCEPLHYILDGGGDMIYSLQDTNRDGKFNSGDFLTIRPRDLPVDASQLERCFYEINLIPDAKKKDSFEISTHLCHDSLKPEFSHFSSKYLDVSNYSKELGFYFLDTYINNNQQEK